MTIHGGTYGLDFDWCHNAGPCAGCGGDDDEQGMVAELSDGDARCITCVAALWDEAIEGVIDGLSFLADCDVCEDCEEFAEMHWDGRCGACTEPEDDGQPDEAQEWADFDPDC